MYGIVILAVLLSLYAQFKVTSTFNKYSKVGNRRGYTGEQVATQMLLDAGITDVSVERVAGNLTDHYDPRTNTLRLSATVYGSASVAALGVAAHETGHAIQHNQGYAPLALRSGFVPLSTLGSKLAFPMIFIGFLFNNRTGYYLIFFGILMFCLAVAFTLITLPVEFNASSRAIALLQGNHFLDEDEIVGAKRVLNAAALTYVAAAIAAIAHLLRLIWIFGRRN